MKHDGMSSCSNIRGKTRLMQYIFETVLTKPVCRDLIWKVVCGFHSLLDTEITDSAVRGIFSLQCVSARLSVRLCVWTKRWLDKQAMSIPLASITINNYIHINICIYVNIQPVDIATGNWSSYKNSRWICNINYIANRTAVCVRSAFKYLASVTSRLNTMQGSAPLFDIDMNHRMWCCHISIKHNARICASVWYRYESPNVTLSHFN